MTVSKTLFIFVITNPKKNDYLYNYISTYIVISDYFILLLIILQLCVKKQLILIYNLLIYCNGLNLLRRSYKLYFLFNLAPGSLVRGLQV